MDSVKFEQIFKVVLSDKQRSVFSCTAPQLNLSGLEGSGKSFTAYCVILDAVLTGLTSVFFVSPTSRQSKEKQSRIFTMIERTGADILTKNIDGLMLFDNGSKIHFVSAEQKNSSVKGFHALVGKVKAGSVIVLIDDATAVKQEFSDAIFASLFTASAWRLILAYNNTDTSSWVYAHHIAGEKNDPDIKTIIFTPADNPNANAEVSNHLKKIDPHYAERFSGRWDSDKYSAFIPEILNPAIDDTYSLNLPAEKGYSYMLGADLNDPMAETVGRDRDSCVFCTVGKKIAGGKALYKVVGVERFQLATISDWLEAIKRQMRIYPIDKLLIESPHASGLLELLKREGIGDRVQLCNPHQRSDTFSLNAGYSYLAQCLQGRLLKIPHDFKELIKEMRELRVEMTESRELRFYHRKHHHNDHIVALLWALLGLKELQNTGSISYSEILEMNRGRQRIKTHDYSMSSISKYDREFLQLPSSREMREGFL